MYFTLQTSKIIFMYIKMTSVPLFFDSRKGQGKSENFIKTFNPPLQLNIKKVIRFL